MFFTAFNALPDYSLAVLNAGPKSISDSSTSGRIELKIHVLACNFIIGKEH